MKKFLLTFFIAFMSVLSYAQVDTVYVKPNDPINFELVVDTAKYPFLKGLEDKVVWEKNGGEIPGEYIKVLNGKKYLDVEKADWHQHDGNYYYKFEADVVTKADISVQDTIKHVHVYETPEIESYTINGAKNVQIYEGDTAFVEVGVKDIMDAKKFLLLNGEDTITRSASPKFYFIPSKDGKQEYHITVVNPFDKATSKTPRVITIIPAIKLESLAYFAQTGEDNYTKTTPNSEMNVNVLNHDSVNIIVNTNAANILEIEGNYGVTYTWNKDGLSLPDGVVVKDGALIISEYNKETMDGKYNCIVSDTKTTFTVTFDVSSTYPTSNEMINANKYKVVCKDGYMIISNATSERLVISNVSGQILVNKTISSDMEQVLVPRNSILFVTIGKETIKTISR